MFQELECFQLFERRKKVRAKHMSSHYACPEKSSREIMLFERQISPRGKQALELMIYLVNFRDYTSKFTVYNVILIVLCFI